MNSKVQLQALPIRDGARVYVYLDIKTLKP